MKRHNPETDPEGFQRLLAAYEQALSAAQNRPASTAVPASGWPDEDNDEEARYETPDLPADGGDLTAACERLIVLVQSGAADADALTAAGEAVLSSPALEVVDCYGRTEAWVAWLIASHIPVTDLLIEPAVERFGWRDLANDFDLSPDIEEVMARERDLSWLEQLRRRDSVNSRAFRALSRPPKAAAHVLGLLWTGLGPEVRELIQRIRFRHPSLHHDLDSDALAWWEGPLRPLNWPPGVAYWLLAGMMSGSIIGLAALNRTAIFPGGAAALGALLGGLVAAGIMATVVFGFGALRDHWQAEWMWRAPAWVETSWLWSAALLLAGSLLAPPSLLGAGFVAAGAVVVLALTHLIAERPEPGAFGVQVALFNLPIAVWWIALVISGTDGATLPRAIAAITAAYAFSFGAVTIYGWVHIFMRRALRVLMVLATLGLAASSTHLLLRMADGSLAGHAADAAVLVTFVILLQRAASLSLGTAALQWRYYAMIAAFWLARGFADAIVEGPAQTMVLVAGGLWFLFGTAYTILMALIGEARDAAGEAASSRA